VQRSHPTLIVLVVVAAIIAAVAVAAIVLPRWRGRILWIIGLAIGGPVAIYLVVRGIAEFWLIDYGNPASYQHDWGGPSLVGVLAVHSGPGLLILIGTIVWYRRRSTRKTRPADHRGGQTLGSAGRSGRNGHGLTDRGKGSRPE
jgi:hypothetical protein